MRDHALVQAFDDEHLPVELRWVLEPSAEENADQAPGEPVSEKLLTGHAAVCACLKQSGECDCCGEPWVLLGSVIVSEDGLGTIDRKDRRYVKPIACACDAVGPDPVKPPPPRIAQPMVTDDHSPPNPVSQK
jgi:hypothetical protein